MCICIKFVSHLRLVAGFLRILRPPPPDIHDTTEQLPKVALNTTTPYKCYSTNWNPVGSRILLVQIGIPIYTNRNWNSDLYWI